MKYDFIIIGGGAIGSSIALDLSSRGYKTLILEKNDFASGTSSKSTKLLHGGVRYLENAIKKLDKSQYDFVKEGLRERRIYLDNASNISKGMEIITPLYSYIELFYMYVGLKLYDIISGSYSIGQSLFLSKKETLEKLPNIKKDKLVGSVKYFDGSFLDFKMVICLLKTAQSFGCHIKNYHEVKSFIKEDGKITGLKAYDLINEEELEFKADVVINASGTYVDKIRTLDDENSLPIIKMSKGSHIVVSKEFLENEYGVLIPKTEDGRVIFMLPWQDSCIIGTTDIETSDSACKKITDDEIEYLLKHINEYLEVSISKEHIKSTFCGVRALVNDENSSSAQTTREHKFEISKSNLISIAGAKWTTSRVIAQECIDFSLKNLKKEPKKECQTSSIKLDDKINFDEKLLYDLEKNKELIEEFILYTIKNEYVKKIDDFISRRVSIALKNKKLALSLVSFVAKVMKEYFSWSKEKEELEIKNAINIIENEF